MNASTSSAHAMRQILWRDVPAAQQGSEPALTLDVPQGMTVAQGFLQEVTCNEKDSAGKTYRFLPDIPTGGKPLELRADKRLNIGFSDTFWWGEDHFSSCNHLAGHRAMVAYDPSDNRLVDIEVRDHLPTEKAGTDGT